MHYQRRRSSGDPGTAEMLRVPGSPDRKSKACTVCRQVKAIAEFYSDKRTRDGRGSQCRQCFGTRNSARRRRRVYGLSPDDYAKLHDRANGHCEACARPTVRLVIDHCHRTGRVRGLLCDSCNTTLGQMEDDANRLSALIAYIQDRGTT